jgi:hypothetical protein
MQGKYPSGEVQTERSQAVSSARIIELVDSRRQDSIRYNSSLFNKLKSYYETYRGLWSGKLNQFRNQLSIPFTFAMIQSDVARKVQTSFGAWPIVTFEGYAPEDVARAKKNEVLISAQMKDADSIIRAVDFFLQADICGTGIARFGWKNLTRKNKYRKMETIAPGLTIPVLYEEDSELFNGPVWETVDRLDFWQQPAIKRIDDMAWVIHRYWADLDDLMEDASGPNPYFDPRAVRLLESAPLTGSGYSEFIERKLAFRNEFDHIARQNERFAKPIEIWEMHGLVPSEFTTDGVRSRCIAIGNGRVVLKNREGPMANQQKPFLSYCPMPDPYSFDGIGKAEIAYGPQRTIDRIGNQKLDAIDLVLDPMWAASDGALNNQSQNLFTRAGRVLLLNGPADETSLRALVPNTQGLQMAYTEMGQLHQFMQVGMGLNDIIMGMQSGDRETARGTLARQENALTRLGMEAALAEQGFIEPLANAFRHMDRLWLPLPQELKILGSMAFVNPITGLPYPQESVQVDHDDLAPDYRARAVGASQMMGKSVKQQNFLALLQMMSANPVMMQMVNWANFARQAFELFDFKNVDELLVQTVPMINQMAQDTGQSPMNVAGMASQDLEQLDPSVLGQMVQSQDLGRLAAA